MAPRPWTCRKCKTRHPSKQTRKCSNCGTVRPKTKRPDHLKALELPYEEYVRINGGEHCGICGKKRKPGARRLNRDHDHSTGLPRGLLCGGRMGCNRKLGRVDDPQWLEAARTYLTKERPKPRV